jgi:cytochrome P450
VISLPPGPRGLPFLGIGVAFARDPFGVLMDTVRNYGDIAFVRAAGVPIYVLSHPSDIHSVLVEKHRLYVKDRFARNIVPVFGRGLLINEGESWRRQRALVAPAFHRQHVEGMAGTIVDVTERTVASWRDGSVIQVDQAMMRLSLNVVLSTLFGGESSNLAPRLESALSDMSPFFESVAASVPSLRWLPTASNRGLRRGVQALNQIVDEVIARGRSSSRPSHMITMLLDARDTAGLGMTDPQLRDEVKSFFLASTDTTALALTYAFHLLGRHPVVDDRLAKEISGTLNGRAPALDDLAALRCTEQVVKESLRLYPPAWIITREPIEDDEIRGYCVPRGSTVAMFPYSVHRDPRFFEDPETFRPERWSPTFEQRLPAQAFFPFGAGPHRCIGATFALMELRLILATIAARFRLTPESEEPLQLRASITARPALRVRMRIRARQ